MERVKREGKKGEKQKDEEGPEGEKENRIGNILFLPVPNPCLGQCALPLL